MSADLNLNGPVINPTSGGTPPNAPQAPKSNSITRIALPIIIGTASTAAITVGVLAVVGIISMPLIAAIVAIAVGAIGICILIGLAIYSAVNANKAPPAPPIVETPATPSSGTVKDPNGTPGAEEDKKSVDAETPPAPPQPNVPEPVLLTPGAPIASAAPQPSTPTPVPQVEAGVEVDLKVADSKAATIEHHLQKLTKYLKLGKCEKIKKHADALEKLVAGSVEIPAFKDLLIVINRAKDLIPYLERIEFLFVQIETVLKSKNFEEIEKSLDAIIAENEKIPEDTRGYFCKAWCDRIDYIKSLKVIPEANKLLLRAIESAKQLRSALNVDSFKQMRKSLDVVILEAELQVSKIDIVYHNDFSDIFNELRATLNEEIKTADTYKKVFVLEDMNAIMANFEALKKSLANANITELEQLRISLKNKIEQLDVDALTEPQKKALAEPTEWAAELAEFIHSIRQIKLHLQGAINLAKNLASHKDEADFKIAKEGINTFVGKAKTLEADIDDENLKNHYIAGFAKLRAEIAQLVQDGESAFSKKQSANLLNAGLAGRRAAVTESDDDDDVSEDSFDDGVETEVDKKQAAAAPAKPKPNGADLGRNLMNMLQGSKFALPSRYKRTSLSEDAGASKEAEASAASVKPVVGKLNSHLNPAFAALGKLHAANAPAAAPKPAAASKGNAGKLPVPQPIAGASLAKNPAAAAS